MRLHYLGKFTPPPNRQYVDGVELFVDLVAAELFTKELLEEIIDEIGYLQPENTRVRIYYQHPNGDMETGLKELVVDEDFQEINHLINYEDVLNVFIEYEVV